MRFFLHGLFVVFSVLATGTTIWAIAQAFERPPDYPEACVVFNAARLRDGLPLYVDPAVGAFEYGLPPTRYFVAYTPIHAAFLSLVPAKHVLAVSRMVGFAAWCGALGLCVRRAFRRSRDEPPDLRSRRRVGTLLAALMVGSLFLFARWSASAKPDALALFLVALALGRSLDRGRADAWAGALFGLAALLKPSVLGAGLGMLGASVFIPLARPSSMWRRGRSGSLAAALVIGLVLGGLQLLTKGAAWHHLEAAVALTFDRRQLVHEALSRLPFVLVVLVSAAVSVARDLSAPRTRDRAAVALVTLGVSTLVSTLALGKRGATINYLMEPALVGVMLLSEWPIALPKRPVARLFFAAVSVVSMIWGGNATARSLLYEASVWGESTRALREISSRCGSASGGLTMSDDPGIELTLNGRIFTHAVELGNEVDRDRFPASLWISDVGSPNVTCFVTFVGDGNAPAEPHPGFPVRVDEALGRRFVLTMRDAGYALYQVRARP